MRNSDISLSLILTWLFHLGNHYLPSEWWNFIVMSLSVSFFVCLFNPVDLQQAFQLKSHLSSFWQNFLLLCFDFLFLIYCLYSLLEIFLIDIGFPMSIFHIFKIISYFVSLFSFYSTFRILFEIRTPPTSSSVMSALLLYLFNF